MTTKPRAGKVKVARVIARVIAKDVKADFGLGPGVIGEAELVIPKTGLSLAAAMAYSEAEIIEKFVKVQWEFKIEEPKKGKRTNVRSKRTRRQ